MSDQTADAGKKVAGNHLTVDGDQLRLARQGVAHIREEADFNRSFLDGRRTRSPSMNEGYMARRLVLAVQRESWADAIEALIDAAERQV